MSRRDLFDRVPVIGPFITIAISIAFAVCVICSIILMPWQVWAFYGALWVVIRLALPAHPVRANVDVREGVVSTQPALMGGVEVSEHARCGDAAHHEVSRIADKVL